MGVCHVNRELEFNDDNCKKHYVCLIFLMVLFCYRQKLKLEHAVVGRLEFSSEDFLKDALHLKQY